LKTRFIINPRSGTGQRANQAVQLRARVRGAEVRLTERPLHAIELAREAVADACELVVAVGGDGTINEIGSALAGTGVTLGLVPCGSGNGLARELGVWGSITRALDIIDSGEDRIIDCGLADGHPFFTVAGLGFEAVLADRFNRLRRRGFVRYLIHGANALRHYRSEQMTIIQDADRDRRNVFTLAVGNAAQYGNNAYIAPRARPDDGQLNLTAVPPLGPWRAPSLLWRLFAGTLDRSSTVSMRTGTRFVVERDAPGLLHTDGEVHNAPAIVVFEIRPACLKVRGPALSR